MSSIKLYIAMSLDGKIAKPDGDVSWLGEIPNPEETDHGYFEFYQSVDTVIMGNNTYKMILSFGGEFPYPDKDCYVFTSNQSTETSEHVSFVSGNIEKFIEKLKSGKEKSIWLVGGGILNTFLLNSELIDELIVFVMPIAIGAGISLFEGEVNQTLFKLESVKQWTTGAVQLNYSILKQ